MNADLERIHIYTDPIDFTRDGLSKIQSAVSAIQPGLIVFDPIQSYIGKIDMNRANEVRFTLDPLVKIARETGCAIIFIAHLNKSNSKSEYRALGSVDFVAICRSMLIAGKDQVDPNRRALFHKKSNCGPYGDTIGYKISDDGFFCWTGESDLTEMEALGSELKSVVSAHEIDDAKDFVLKNIDSVGKATRDLKDLAKNEDISSRTLERALYGLRDERRIVKKDNLWTLAVMS